MSDKTGPRGPSPYTAPAYTAPTSGALPGSPAEPNLPRHGTPIGGEPADGIHPDRLPPSGKADFPPPMTASGTATDKAREAGDSLRDAAGEMKNQGGQAVETLKQEGGAVLDAAQQRASSLFEEQKRAGADQAEGLARAVHSAADQLQDTSPQIAGYVHEAASSVDRMARTLRDRGPNQLLHDAQDLARQQPVAFFGAAVLAGFAIARFARASTPAGASAEWRNPAAKRDTDHDLDRDTDGALGSRSGMGTTPTGAAGMGPGGATAAGPGWTPVQAPGEATRGGHR